MSVEPVVQVSAIEHWEYCPRQCALIHVDGVWIDNEHTVRGSRAHRRVDSGEHRMERGVRVLRSIPLWSERLGLTGRADAVEVHLSGEVVPVEYKSGTPHGDAALLQVCAQAMCLEEMLKIEIRYGAVWYQGLRRRTKVHFDEFLRMRTIDIVASIRESLVSGVLPRAVDDDRCDACQLINHCLPRTVARPSEVLDYLHRQVFGCVT